MNSTFHYHAFKQSLEIRESKKTGVIGVLTGRAVVYGVESVDMGGWREVILRGAFTKALAKDQDICLFNQHDSKQVLARRSGGSLTLNEDADGVTFEAEFADTTHGRNTLADVRAKNLDGMSFGMPYGSVTARWEAASATRDYDLRYVSEADIVEVSVVTWPTYEETAVSTRCRKEYQEQFQQGNEIARNTLLLQRHRHALQKHQH